MLIIKFGSKSFNSRPHEEVDVTRQYLNILFNLSTHDLTRRSTKKTGRFFKCVHLSTHDLTRRSTRNQRIRRRDYVLSTHDLTRRSTFPIDVFSFFSNLSTHDLTRRSTKLMLRSRGYSVLSTHDLTRRSTLSGFQLSFSGRFFQLTTSRGGRRS